MTPEKTMPSQQAQPAGASPAKPSAISAPEFPALSENCDPATVRKIANRLRRARGQLDAVITAVESGGQCRDVLTQLAAVRKALNRAGFVIVSATMTNCLATDEEPAGDDVAENSEEILAELEKLVLLLS